MKKLLPFFLLFLFYSSVSGQFCTTGGPSSTLNSNVQLVQLNGNTTNINYTGCPGVAGVEDQTAQVADLTAGNTYSLVIDFGSCGSYIAGAGTAWIDWDGNSGFDASEVVGTWTGIPPYTATFNFTVPAGACNGTNGLRVMQQEGAVLPLYSCAAFTYGSVTDFSVSISLGNCSLAGLTYCSGGPTTNADSNVQSVQFTGNTSNINFTGTCPGYLGVQDATAMVADVTAGSNYPLNVQFGTCGGGYYGSGEIWIDFNQDHAFDASESVGTWSGTPPVSVSSYTVSILASAVNGITRMRVMQYEGASLPLDPCASFSWGSVADFSIDISGGISCSGYQGDYFADAIPAGLIPYIDTNSTSICYTSYSTVYPSPDVYYQFITNPTPSSVKISLCNSSFDTYLSILDKTGTLISYNDDGPCGTNAEIVLNVAGQDTLYAVVEGWNTEKGNFIIEITDITGIIDVERANEISVFPNPAHTSVSIISANQLNSIEIRSAGGQLISTFNAKEKHDFTMSVEALDSGIYFVKVIDRNGSYAVKKLIIQ